MRNNHAYHSWDLLQVFQNVSLGDTLRETFRKVAASRGPLHGYLTAVQIVITGSMTQSAATAALAKELLWDLLTSITLEGNQHWWLSNTPGIVVFQQEFIDEILQGNNGDDWVMADFANDQDAHVFTQSYMIPMSPKLFRSNHPGKGEKDGMFPLAGMRDHGRIEFVVRNAGLGDWELTSGTYLTIKVLLHTYWTDEVSLPAPWRLDTFTSTDSEVQFPARYGACDSAWCGDQSLLEAFTLPTSNCVFIVDDMRLYDNLTGAMLEYVANRTGRIDSLDDEVDLQMVPIYLPTQQHSLFEVPTGRIFKCRDYNSGQSGGDTRYVMRRFLPANPEQTATWLDLMGVKFDAASDKGRITVARLLPGKGVPSAKDRLAGANLRVST